MRMTLRIIGVLAFISIFLWVFAGISFWAPLVSVNEVYPRERETGLVFLHIFALIGGVFSFIP